jgi:hypothetical protein
MTTTPGEDPMTTATTQAEIARAEAAVRRAHAAGKCLAIRDGSALQPFYGDYNEHDPDAPPKTGITDAEAFDCYLGHKECARCRWLRAHLGLPQHRDFREG